MHTCFGPTSLSDYDNPICSKCTSSLQIPKTNNLIIWASQMTKNKFWQTHASGYLSYILEPSKSKFTMSKSQKNIDKHRYPHPLVNLPLPNVPRLRRNKILLRLTNPEIQTHFNQLPPPKKHLGVFPYKCVFFGCLFSPNLVELCYFTLPTHPKKNRYNIDKILKMMVFWFMYIFPINKNSVILGIKVPPFVESTRDPGPTLATCCQLQPAPTPKQTAWLGK